MIQCDECGVRVGLPDYGLELVWYGADIVRVRRYRGDRPAGKSFAVVAAPAKPQAIESEKTEGGMRITGGNIAVTIDASGVLDFFYHGRLLLKEKPGSFNLPRNSLPNPADRYGAEQGFELSADEGLYGLGQFPDGVMNWRGHKATLIHGNVTVVVPFIVSTNGWGLLWDNPSHTEFSDDDGGMRFWSEVGDGVDYYLCAGADADEVIGGYRHLTGAAPLFPRAFYGFIQCKERYQTADELVEVVREHRKRGLPLDVIVQDWMYWGRGEDTVNKWSGMRHDPESYGDLPQAVRAIHEMHAKVMISIWPRIGLGSELGRELYEKGLMFEGKPGSKDKVYDAFCAEARAIYWKHVKRELFDLGIDAWWMDGTEPEFEDCHDAQVHKASLLAQRDTAAGSWARVLNAFCLATTGGVYEQQRECCDDKRVFILTRSAFAGQQRNGAATWSGDVSANWQTFANQVPSGLNFCMAGIPYWTTDNGAFFVQGRGATFPEGIKDPAFREFFLRWFQYSCFCPLMRSHGTQTPREIWQFGEPGDLIYDSLAAFAGLRMRLLPYSYSLAARTTFHGGTPMRALAMDFPHDRNVYGIADQFMYGPALMACPVLFPMVHPPRENDAVFAAKPDASQERKVYLPEGMWYDFWSGEKYAGAADYMFAAPLERIPVLVRAGTILPLGPHRQWHAEKPDDLLELRIYPGADGAFVLYEDAGDSYAYERGEYSEITLRWSDRERKLSLERRRGAFPGMLKERTFNVVEVAINRGGGIAPEEKPSAVIRYDGSAASHRLQ